MKAMALAMDAMAPMTCAIMDIKSVREALFGAAAAWKGMGDILFTFHPTPPQIAGRCNPNPATLLEGYTCD